MIFSCSQSEEDLQFVVWQQRNPIPNAIGWAGMSAGASRGVLIAGGGANFPDRPPWAGGTKAWSKELFVLPTQDGVWKSVSARFPQPLAYAVCVSDGQQVIMAGGESPLEEGAGTRCRDEVLKLEWSGSDVQIFPLPALPVPITNAAGALVGTDFYVAGGTLSPSATTAENHVFCLDSSSPESHGWKTIESFPGPGRMLAVAAAWDGRFYLFGGVSLSQDDHGKPVRTPLVDCYCFAPAAGWKRLADLPVAVTAAPSPAPAFDGRIVLLGGDDGSQMNAPPEQHRGFSSRFLTYDVEKDCFHNAGSFPAPRVTAPLVPWDQSWFLISGELRPGVRSPAVWQFSLNNMPPEE